MNLQLLQAISFSARVHRFQFRKDGITPYAAHPFRVCLITRDLFGIDDPQVLMTAVLHDTLEDTTTDYDDLAEAFGDKVAGWVAQLSKDMRLPEPSRELAYIDVLTKADWPVQICKLGDIYDNLTDSEQLSENGRESAKRRSRAYLDALGQAQHPECAQAWVMVNELLFSMP